MDSATIKTELDRLNIERDSVVRDYLSAPTEESFARLSTLDSKLELLKKLHRSAQAQENQATESKRAAERAAAIESLNAKRSQASFETFFATLEPLIQKYAVSAFQALTELDKIVKEQIDKQQALATSANEECKALGLRLPPMRYADLSHARNVSRERILALAADMNANALAQLTNWINPYAVG